MPGVTKTALLVNPANRALAQSDAKEARDTAHALGVNLLVLDASSQSEIDAAFAILIREQAGALMTNSESLFMVHSNHAMVMSAFAVAIGGKADIGWSTAYPLLTQSGHRRTAVNPNCTLGERQMLNS